MTDCGCLEAALHAVLTCRARVAKSYTLTMVAYLDQKLQNVFEMFSFGNAWGDSWPLEGTSKSAVGMHGDPYISKERACHNGGMICHNCHSAEADSVSTDVQALHESTHTRNSREVFTEHFA